MRFRLRKKFGVAGKVFAWSRAARVVLTTVMLLPIAAVVRPAQAEPTPSWVQECTGETHLGDKHDDGPFPCLGEIDFEGAGLSAFASTNLFVNPARRLLVTGLVESSATGEFVIAQFPLDDHGNHDVPGEVEVTPIHDANSSVPWWAFSSTQSPLAYDAVHHRMFISPGCGLLTSTEDKLCFAGADLGRIRSVDLVTGATSTFEFPEEYRGQWPRGLAYDASHEVLYVLTEVAHANLAIGVASSLASIGTSTAVHAIDARLLSPGPDIDPDAAHLWSHNTDLCPAPLTKGSRVAAFGVGQDGSFVHFGCKANQTFLEQVGLASNPVDVSEVQVREPGVLHVDLLNGRDPEQWDPRDEPVVATSFSTSYHPFSGNSFWGEGAVSESGDHLFVGPGGVGDKSALVFDGRVAGYVGSRAMASNGSMTGWVSDGASGRAYLTDHAGMYIVDTAVTPVADGAFLPRIAIPHSVYGAVDAETGRVFIAKPAGRDGIDTRGGIRVFRDQTSPPPTA